MARAARLWVRELVDQLHLLNEVAGDVASDLAEVVLAELVADPEADVLVAGRVLGVGHELRRQDARLELLGKALVVGPEETDVGDVEQHHGKPLEPEAKRPRLAVAPPGVVEDRLLHDAAPEHLEPLALEEDLQLEGGLREGEVGIHPSHLNVAEEVPREPLERPLEVALGELLLRAAGLGGVLRGEEADSLHLVKDRVVGRVDRVAPVDVAGDEEVCLALAEHLCLMGRGVAPEDRLVVDVVRVVGAPGDVVLGDEDVVKVRLGRDDGVKVVERLEHPRPLRLEELLDGRLDDAEGVCGALVEVDADLLEDDVRHVVHGVLVDDLISCDDG
mmetsp:Transcript_875/g.2094  ORF Transcript_875/g.2094 Transcript_875/m.2094 type:complete len:332 (+) Transcript_875:310-1305(+)